jgi:hypothetical protein
VRHHLRREGGPVVGVSSSCGATAFTRIPCGGARCRGCVSGASLPTVTARRVGGTRHPPICVGVRDRQRQREPLHDWAICVCLWYWHMPGAVVHSLLIAAAVWVDVRAVPCGRERALVVIFSGSWAGPRRLVTGATRAAALQPWSAPAPGQRQADQEQ